MNLFTLVCLCQLGFICNGQFYVNIAKQKLSRQKSTYYSDYYGASKAVDNDENTFSHTEPGLNEWWEVDLGRNYYVKDIRISTYYEFESRIASTTISVDSRVCASVPKYPNATITVSCPNFMYGRTIRITKDDNASDKILRISEFEVIGCLEGYYGDNCSKVCLSPNCLNNECDRLTGHCIDCKRNYKTPECTECAEGKYGRNCLEECGQCAGNDECNGITGHCPSCANGIQPPLCQNECEIGFYGEKCQQVCGNCRIIAHCRRDNGVCQSGCAAGFHGDRCLSRDSPDVLIIGGFIMGGCLILAVSISVTAIYLKRFKNRMENNQLQVESQSSFNRTRRLQGQVDLLMTMRKGMDYNETESPHDSVNINVLDVKAKYTPAGLVKMIK